MYSYLLEFYKSDPNIIVVGYESLCEDTTKVWAHLMSCIDVPIDSFPRFDQRKSEIPDINDYGLLTKSKDVFGALIEISRV